MAVCDLRRDYVALTVVTFSFADIQNPIALLLSASILELIH